MSIDSVGWRAVLIAFFTAWLCAAAGASESPGTPPPRPPLHKAAPPTSEPLNGAASMYDPTDHDDRDSGDMTTASGESYDPDDWTAAIQVDLRERFGGVRYGKNYRVSFALVEAGGKRAIVRINDVGPLRPGRIIDLNRRAMRYFDPAMTTGLLADVKVTPLADTEIAVGPFEDAPVLAGDFEVTNLSK
jgi:rare lipoprotein A